MHNTYLFDDFFSSGKEETISPFLTPSSRHWGKNLQMKSALTSGVFLLVAFIFSFYQQNVSNLCLVVVFFLSGTNALIETIHDLKHFEINIDTLMTLAAFLSVLIGSQLEGGLLLVLFAFSGAMEELVESKAKGALVNLHDLAPTMATVVDIDGTIHQKSCREIQVGTTLLVRPGEVIPLDGIVKDGQSFVNLVHLTGESVPISKKIEEEVQAGSRNLDGTLTVTVTRSSQDSTLSQIIKLVGKAQEMKPKFQRFLDKFGRIYATTVIALFFFFALTLPLFLSINYLGEEGSIYRALAFLIAASPCALIIATPTAYLSAISSCARKGILLKGGVALDALASSKLIAFDKTGTLTTGKLTCHSIDVLKDGTEKLDSALLAAASLERHSKHPMAEAICKYAEEKGILPEQIDHFLSHPGLGLEGTIQGKKAFIGNKEFIGKKIADARLLDSIEKEGYLITILLLEESIYIFHFEDTIRPLMKDLIQEIENKHHMETVMVTGDHEKSAHFVAKELGIKNVYANLRVGEKLDTISTLSKDKRLAMIGDGVNDAPALMRATVGISLGTIGSSAAIDASDIVLLRDELPLLSWLIKKSNATSKIVKENITLALSVIFLATTPALLGFIPLWLAVILHEGGTVIVGLNSLRLLKK